MAARLCNYARRGVGIFFEYDTPKIVHIRSKSIGIINRIIQLAVVSYIIVWVLILKKGYQEPDTGVSGTTTKVKGVAFTNISDPKVGIRAWDTADIVVPAEENDAFFVTTNVIQTMSQANTQCPEAFSVAQSRCTTDADCQPVGTPFLLGHGTTTGVCNMTTSTCMINAWCPLEDDVLPLNGTTAALAGTVNFTVLIKNHVYFPLYKQTRSNIIEETNKTYLQGCHYDKLSDPFCPIFTLGYIVNAALEKSTSSQTYEDVATEGGVFSIRIDWDCDFDYNPKWCKPLYSFDRLDKGEDSLVARGYNFRYAHYYYGSGERLRDLVKAYGLKFIVTVNAKGGKFNVVPLFLNIGSGLGLLAMATILCDIFVLYIHRRRKFFNEHKYEQVKTSDAYQYTDSISVLNTEYD